MPIQILSEDLAAKIAAGEVIERPASVVKELVENSLDAGARDIRIEVRGGGQRLLRVADDGCGIPAAEVPIAFARHATSKLKNADDLFAIRTLGFRGEALPSIAAVARLTLITRAQGQENGTNYKIEGSRVLSHQPFGAPQGTVISVEELFGNVPARLKFMKAPGSEAARIAELVNAFALAYPHVRFTLVNDGRLLFQSYGNGKLADALNKVFGVETAHEMIEVSNPTDTGSLVQVHGYISPPSIHRGTRKLQYLFVNGRWVEDRSISHAILEAYHTLLMVGRFPLFVLNIQIPLDAVDVNVHPTKQQVRFREPGDVYTMVQRTVRRALTAHTPIPVLGTNTAGRPPATDGDHRESPWDQPRPEGVPLGPTANSDRKESSWDQPLTATAGSPLETSSQPSLPTVHAPLPAAVPMLRVIGQIASTYIIAEGPDGMYLVDQHAAHERVLYEQFMAEHAARRSPSQELLQPVTVDLSPTAWAIFAEQHEALEHVGFRIEGFGGQTMMLRAVPAVCKNRDPRKILGEVLDEMVEGAAAPMAQDQEARLITSICKSAAVKGGQTLSLDEMRTLIRDLEKTTSPRTCPHGRPTMIQLNLGQLEKEFGRRG
ncbi:MAG: DNA mismatch repair endonuclease MutL [Anaerolineae bacterium]